MKAGLIIADRFVLEERVGAGGMGAVWRAHDLAASADAGGAAPRWLP